MCRGSRRPASSCACRPRGGRIVRRARRSRATVGGKPPSGLGTDALLDFQMDVTLDGEPLTAGGDRAAARRRRTACTWCADAGSKSIARSSSSMLDAVPSGGDGRGAGRPLLRRSDAPARRRARAGRHRGGRLRRDWSRVVAGPWLAQDARRPARSRRNSRSSIPAPALKATLRPYQQVGVRWLHLLSSLGLGACLADDMGLGKTMQVLALLLRAASARTASARASARNPSLLVAPASLLANWAAEIERFAPTLTRDRRASVGDAGAELKALDRDRIAGVDLVITSYGSLLRVPALLADAVAPRHPRRSAGDQESRREADARGQAARRARRASRSPARRSRIGSATCGRSSTSSTPACWDRGKAFSAFTKRLAAQPHNAYAPLRELVRPYILRRLKTDKSVIADLPDKTEVQGVLPPDAQAGGALSAVGRRRWRRSWREPTGMKRRGVVLASLMRLKQICNHPSQWLGDGAWREADSGKLARLREIAEVIAAKQEKVLVFTQFREMTAPLAAFLGSRLRPPGPRAARRDGGRASARRWCGSSRRTSACRSSCSR